MDTPPPHHPRYAAAVWRLELRGQIILWHDRTGRHAALSPETAAELEQGPAHLPPPPHLAAVAQRLAGLHLLADRPPPDLRALRPARHRRVLLLPDTGQLWGPLPDRRTAGGFPYAARTLTPGQLRLWRACNGARTLAEAIALADISDEDALRFCATLTHPAVQALQLRDRPARARDPGLLHLVAPERPLAARSPDQYGPGGQTTLAAWHTHDITDGTHHFDDRETTVSHAFGLPHPALHDQPYGARLLDALQARGWLPAAPGTTLEIGPGDGELGAAWRAHARTLHRDGGEHIRLDLSPALLATQRERQPGTREILASATDIPLPDGTVDLILCNEVIADLTAVPLDLDADADDDLAHIGDAHAVRERIQRYRLTPLLGNARYNLGAWQLIEEVVRLLAPGGVAFLTEFGDLEERPRETTHLDHPEVSIHFGHLIQIAQHHGLSVRLLPLAELLEADLQARWLSRHSHEALRALAHARGDRLDARAWTPETLPLPVPVEGIEWTPITDHGPGPLITRFPALILHRQSPK